MLCLNTGLHELMRQAKQNVAMQTEKKKEGVAEKTYQIGHMCELVKSKANVHKPTYRQVSECCKKFKCASINKFYVLKFVSSSYA